MTKEKRLYESTVKTLPKTGKTVAKYRIFSNHFSGDKYCEMVDEYLMEEMTKVLEVLIEANPRLKESGLVATLRLETIE